MVYASRLEELTAKSHAMADELEKRLEPVLRPDEPKPDTEAALNSVRLLSPMGDRLANSTLSINRLIGRLRNLMQRIDL